MKKVVLLVRVSSVSQEYEAQTSELIEFVKRDGYTFDEMEIIQDKESATKLSDEERQGLNKMYAAIKDTANKIEAVYCWELSRLSRKPVTLWNVKQILWEKEIDLRTKHENLRMLNNPHFDTMFSIYVVACQSEVSTRVERTKRSKMLNALKGGYSGGDPNIFIKYGYKIENKMLVTDEEKAPIVEKIFQLYSTGKYGHKKLLRELTESGMNKDLSVKFIGKILTSKLYTGELIPESFRIVKGKKLLSYARRYPAIITPEIFEKCREIAQKNTTVIDKSKNIYFGNKLIKCRQCGRNFKPNKGSGKYICVG